MKFDVLNETNASSAAKEILSSVKEQMGFVPNILGIMAYSPIFLSDYIRKYEGLTQGALEPKYLQLLLIRFSYLNHCKYCQSAHTPVAKMSGANEEEIKLAKGIESNVTDDKLLTLFRFADSLHHDRGVVDKKVQDEFLEVGFKKDAIFDVINAYSLKVMSNYLNHIAKTEID